MEKLDAVYGGEKSELDSRLKSMQWKSLRREEW
jgi:hypothetical protein